MAKNTVFIDVVVDDKGTAKDLAVDADKLGILRKTSTSARTADRNLKGAVRTCNQTKNFSKNGTRHHRRSCSCLCNSCTKEAILLPLSISLDERQM